MSDYEATILEYWQVYVDAHGVWWKVDPKNPDAPPKRFVHDLKGKLDEYE